MHKKILLFRSDLSMCETIRDLYEIKTASTLSEARDLFRDFKPNVIICREQMLGKEITELAKEHGTKLLAILSDGRSEPFEIRSSGAHDVLFPPFSSFELISRIENIVSEPESIKIFRIGQMTVDCENCHVYISDKLLHLTMLEYKLICLLVKNAGQAVDYNTIMRELWQTPIGNEILSLRVFVNAIRRKIKSLGDSTEYIRTRTGVGYIIPIEI